uniref:NADH-ubiquinone oxidoreductase chain 4L n=1 Tax=Cynoglossus nanhaiensis TaxID=2213132 RepID=A0A7L7SBK9_9PLEU|nr:NADH dehydrogenase subunit 4L [Cynoglossus nanhaiensis]AWQ65115.1 NADH dehydrogenase subunit-4L [Cynoglossus nanhaiensis]QNV46921.1 NADH dehydrogenase subunit 4L [Cynoglossus nanhaiensis]
MPATQFTLCSMFFLGLTGVTFYRSHLLSALLCLEGLMLSLFLLLAIWSLQTNATSFTSTPMLLLAFSACEAGAGLALLVATTRTHGIADLNVLTSLRW